MLARCEEPKSRTELTTTTATVVTMTTTTAITGATTTAFHRNDNHHHHRHIIFIVPLVQERVPNSSLGILRMVPCAGGKRHWRMHLLQIAIHLTDFTCGKGEKLLQVLGFLTHVGEHLIGFGRVARHLKPKHG